MKTYYLRFNCKVFFHKNDNINKHFERTTKIVLRLYKYAIMQYTNMYTHNKYIDARVQLKKKKKSYVRTMQSIFFSLKLKKEHACFKKKIIFFFLFLNQSYKNNDYSNANKT